MPSRKEQGIGAAVIAGIVALIIAYWQFVYKPGKSSSPEAVQYAGRVIDDSSQQAIKAAKVSVDAQGLPQVYYTDSDGVFYLKLSGSTGAIRIRVEAKGYEMFDRNVSVTRTGVEDIRLKPNPAPTPSPTATPTASSTPAQSVNRVTEPQQRSRNKRSDNTESILLGRKKGPPVN